LEPLHILVEYDSKDLKREHSFFEERKISENKWQNIFLFQKFLLYCTITLNKRSLTYLRNCLRVRRLITIRHGLPSGNVRRDNGSQGPKEDGSPSCPASNGQVTQASTSARQECSSIKFGDSWKVMSKPQG
jgi:hypothetical protein